MFGSIPRLNVILWILVALLVAVVGIVYAPTLLGASQAKAPATVVAAATRPPTATHTPTTTPSAEVPAGQPQSLVSLPSPAAGAKLFAFGADPARTGYASPGQESVAFGDRNLHVGFIKGKVFQSVLQFNLASLAPGTRILYADVQLTGLSRDFVGAEGEWQLDLLQPDAVTGSGSLSPVDLQSATSAGEIGQKIGPGNLLADQPNQFIFAPDQYKLLESAIATDGLVTFRLSGPTGPSDSLFTWDAGAGVAARAPVLRLVAVPAQFVIVPNDPTPANVMTLAASQATATAFADKFGTPTPYPRNYATATPILYVTEQPTPANKATEAALSAYATAVAMTTGTFTPTPANWIVITPVPATGTPLPTATPLPTWTPTAIALANLTPVVKPTPKPNLFQLLQTPVPSTWQGDILFYSNRFAGRSLLAMSPAGDMLATQPTGNDPYTLSLAREPLSPDHTRRASVAPDANGILQIWIADLSNNLVSQVTHIGRSNGYSGQAYDPVWSPDGSRIAYVSTETRSAEIYVYDLGSQVSHRITATNDAFIFNQRPSWSPDSQQIVFKSNREGGHFQIWVMNADGSNPLNLSHSESDDTDPVWVK